MPELSEDDHKYCQGQSCKDLTDGRSAIKICHHSDCQELNNMTPLLLCEDCDREVHVGPATSHLRFDLPKTLRRTPSVKSNNSDSGTEDDSDPRFDKKYRSYASARKFFNISAGTRKKARRHNTDDPGREFISIRFYQPDGSYEVEIVPALKGKSLKDSVEHMYENRRLSFDTHSVFLEASNTPLPLAFDTFPLGGNILHVRPINEMKVDERIIAMAKQDRDDNDKRSSFNAIRKDSISKVYSSQRSRKNIMAYLGEEEQKSVPSSPENAVTPKSKLPQRRSGLFQGQRFREVNRPFHDVLMYFKVHGIENGFDAQYGEMGDQETIQMEESWTMVIESSLDFPKKLRDQQEAIWELLTTEISYISKLRVIIKLFLVCLEGLQAEKHLTEVDVTSLFGNIREVYMANMEFWKDYLAHVVDIARQEKTPLSPDVLENGFSRFADVFLPYIQYCTEENNCLLYLKSKMKESEKFREYLEWCENHKLCNRLKLTDLLVKPMQRVTKYPLLLKAILKKTQEAEQQRILEDMINNVETFVSKINTTIRIRQEEKKLRHVISRIDLYTPVEPVNDEVEKILSDHCAFDLEGSVPGLPENEHRCVLKEGAMKLVEKQGRSDIYVFLFTDMFLITKLKRGVDKYRIIKQPYRLSKVVLHPLRDSSGFLFIYLNEYNVLTNAFVLTSAGSATDQQEWIQAIDLAKKRYVSARLGQGSTYDFFEDSNLLPYQPSPQHSPVPSRRFLNSPDTLSNSVHRSKSAELALPSSSQGDLAIRKTRASSHTEPQYSSAPSVSDSRSRRSDNRVTRSRSDPKAEKNPRLSAITERGKSSALSRPENSFWEGSRPISMVADSTLQDYSMSSIVEERRARSESLPLEPEEAARRSDRFRTTHSDSALSHKNEQEESMKTCASVPLMGSSTNVSHNPNTLRKKDDFISDDNSNSTLSLSSSNNMPNGSVSSSSASMSVEHPGNESVLFSVCPLSGLSNKSEGETSPTEIARESPEERLQFQKLSGDDGPPVPEREQFRDQPLPEPDFALGRTFQAAEVQTEAIATSTMSVGIQCELIDCVNNCSPKENRACDRVHVERAVSTDALEASSSDFKANGVRNQGDCKVPRRPILRHSMSETDIDVSDQQICEGNGFIHSRSLSDGIKPIIPQARSTPTSPRLGKSSREGPGMRALQVLSQNLETSIHNRTRSFGSAPKRTDPTMPKPLKRLSSSPRSLRRFALLNTSPKLDRKDRSTDSSAEANRPSGNSKYFGAVPKVVKRSSWHVDTISKLEQMEKGLTHSIVNTDGTYSAPNPDSPVENSKGKKDKSSKKAHKEESGKKKGSRKSKNKRWTISEMPGGVVSGPNLDKRGVRKHFLDESLIFGAPEYV